MKKIITSLNDIEIFFHGTCSQHIKKIANMGLLPNSQTGILSSGVENDNEESTEAFNLSLNRNGIYLASDNVAEGYANSAVYVDGIMPAFPLVIKVKVETSKLLPDIDDLGDNYEFESNVLQWQQSYDVLSQIVHDGPIDINQIIGVRFSNSIKDVIPDEDYEYEEYYEEKVKKHLNNWYSIDEIINIINEIKNNAK